MLAVTDVVGELELLTWAGDGSGPVDVQVEDAYRAIDAALREAGTSVLQERVFGHRGLAPVVARARARATGSDNDAWAVPPTFIEGAPVGREGLAGIHIIAARAESSRLVTDGERVLGRVVEAPGARLVGLADLGRFGGRPAARDCAGDARATIDAAEHALVNEGFSYRDVARTWFYLRDILSWYDSFNAARSAAFRRMSLIGPGGDGAIPASTGIGGCGTRGAWCTLDLIAAQAREGQRFEMVRLRNSRQNEAAEYGSAFARGMSLTLGHHRYLFISGTASIDTSGATIHVGDFDGQTTQTLEAIAALLEGAGASLRDIRQATVFIKNPTDAGAFECLARHTRLAAVPLVTTIADVCRDDLLFEIDAIAVVPVRREIGQ